MQLAHLLHLLLTGPSSLQTVVLSISFRVFSPVRWPLIVLMMLGRHPTSAQPPILHMTVVSLKSAPLTERSVGLRCPAWTLSALSKLTFQTNVLFISGRNTEMQDISSEMVPSSKIRSRTSQEPLRLTIDDGSLHRSLERCTVLPGLFTALIVASMLPGARALGGYRQTVGLPLIRFQIAIGVGLSGDAGLLAALKGDKLPGVWGHRILKPADGNPFQEIERAEGVSPLLPKYAEIPLTQACGDLASFTTDPIWAAMSASIASSTITRASDEWKWSGC